MGLYPGLCVCVCVFDRIPQMGKLSSKNKLMLIKKLQNYKLALLNSSKHRVWEPEGRVGIGIYSRYQKYYLNV